MFSRRDCLKLGLGVSASSLLGANAVFASQFVPIPFAELVRTSSRIWLALPLESQSEWIETRVGKLIVTHTRVACEDEVMAGSGHASELWVRTLGGSIGKLGQLVPGEAKLRVGERCVVFLSRPSAHHAVNGMAQGHYALRREARIERLSANVEALSARAAKGSAVSMLADRELNEALSRIKSEAR
jgi:hypothetical protein